MADRHSPPYERLRYFTGQYLEAADMQAEQAYHREMRFFGNRGLFRRGIRQGYTISKKDATTITVAPGMAQDTFGRELLLTAVVDLAVVAPPDRDRGIHLYQLLVIAGFAEREGAPVVFSGDDKSWSGAIRYTEGVDLSIKPAGFQPPDGQIVIGYLNMNDEALVSVVTDPVQLEALKGGVIVGTGANDENHALTILGPNQPWGEGSHQDLIYSFFAAGSARVRAYRGASWGTYLQLMTTANTAGKDDPTVRLHIDMDGHVGIGTTKPAAQLHVGGTGGQSIDFLVNGRLKSDSSDGGLWISSDRFVGGHDTDKLSLMTNNAWRLTVLKDGKVGIGTTTPGARLSVVADAATEITGTAQSSTLKISAGSLGGAAGSELNLASFGFNSPNNNSLGIRAYRVADGADWKTVAIGLGIDVDNTPRVNDGSLWLHPAGRVGIGSAQPAENARLHVVGGALAISLDQSLVRADAAVHVSGGFGRLLQMNAMGASRDGLNLLASTNVASEHQWWSWGTTSTNTWRIKSGTDFGGDSGLTIDGDGKIGIGTTNPQARLEIAGGELMPAAGGDTKSGIRFSIDPESQHAHSARIRYSNINSTNSVLRTLELRVGTDTDDIRYSDPMSKLLLDTQDLALNLRGFGANNNPRSSELLIHEVWFERPFVSLEVNCNFNDTTGGKYRDGFQISGQGRGPLSKLTLHAMSTEVTGDFSIYSFSRSQEQVIELLKSKQPNTFFFVTLERKDSNGEPLPPQLILIRKDEDNKFGVCELKFEDKTLP